MDFNANVWTYRRAGKVEPYIVRPDAQEHAAALRP